VASDQLDPVQLDQAAAELGMGGKLAPEASADAYRRRMERRKEVQQQRVGERNLEKGLVLVFTGDGKGKTTAALGLVLRTLGHGEQVAVVQFIKGGWQPGEAKALELFGDALHWHALGEGFTWETQDRDRDRELVQQAWQRSLLYLADGERKLVVLDEVNVALKLATSSSIRCWRVWRCGRSSPTWPLPAGVLRRVCWSVPTW